MISKRTLVVGMFAVAVTLAVQSSARQEAAPQQKPEKAPAGAPAKSPIPLKFTNLQVLPKEIGRKELVDIMKGLCKTTHERCSSCHVATDDLSEADFPSDEKDAKKNARELLRMILEAKKTTHAQ